MAHIDPPTMRMYTGVPYVPPTAWHQTAGPCNCACPDCERWTIFLALMLLTPPDNGACYMGSNQTVVMPLTGSVTEPWCVSLKGGLGDPLTVYVAERLFEGVIPHFVIGGVSWDYFTLASGKEACICFRDGNWVVTGDATGRNEGPT